MIVLFNDITHFSWLNPRFPVTLHRETFLDLWTYFPGRWNCFDKLSVLFLWNTSWTRDSEVILNLAVKGHGDLTNSGRIPDKISHTRLTGRLTKNSEFRIRKREAVIPFINWRTRLWRAFHAFAGLAGPALGSVASWDENECRLQQWAPFTADVWSSGSRKRTGVFNNIHGARGPMVASRVPAHFNGQQDLNGVIVAVYGLHVCTPLFLMGRNSFLQDVIHHLLRTARFLISSQSASARSEIINPIIWYFFEDWIIDSLTGSYWQTFPICMGLVLPGDLHVI